jgi:hypothetical protein
MSARDVYAFAQPGLWPNAEQRLVLQAALLPDARAIDAFDAWRGMIDLDAEFDYEVFRLLPLLHANLHRLHVDDSLMGRLKGTHRMSWVKTHQLFAKIGPLIAGLRAAGIDVMLLKGAPLVLAYYRNYGLRPMADIDVLVPPQQARRAIETAGRLGWRPAQPVSDDLLRFRHALQMVDGEGGEFDLHWHALVEFCGSNDDDLFWRAPEPLRFGDADVVMPNPTLMLFHTVVHGVRWNAEPPIRWIADAMVILRERGDAIDWEQITALARERRIADRLHLGLAYLQRFFDAAVPPRVMQALAAMPRSWTERIEARSILVDQHAYYNSPLGNLWMLFSEYTRLARGQSPLAFINGFSHFLRWRWALDGRSRIPAMVARGVWKRIARSAP